MIQKENRFSFNFQNTILYNKLKSMPVVSNFKGFVSGKFLSLHPDYNEEKIQGYSKNKMVQFETNSVLSFYQLNQILSYSDI